MRDDKNGDKQKINAHRAAYDKEGDSPGNFIFVGNMKIQKKDSVPHDDGVNGAR